ncbi:hypothetical protein GN157_04230 [Flavobacterium rakeshii]|uniref:Uncharacterized protein n=1 Tax=Flavobacterium rakeshii TaxID=1038845 RepID=A0A6N8H8I4_9FLAO|nr:hypothetical protein [Flavobacterium rakeshii]MUV02909.1 hypothetical protein [Flavobacterium rakeshii]
MIKTVELIGKLNFIRDFWNHYVLEYQFCQKKIRFDDDIKTNYIGIIFGYFDDTFDLLSFSKSNTQPNFSYQISLLQTIYVQQDFIEQMLYIFKCRKDGDLIDKSKLKVNSNYSINREIRNELIGHPIRMNKGQLISASLFGYDTTSFTISYSRYHKENNHNFEHKKEEVSDILRRHSNFINEYFDIIIQKVKTILEAFEKNLDDVKRFLNNKNFESLINILSIKYESIFDYNYNYEPNNLKLIYSNREKHLRYKNLIDKFYFDLVESLTEKIESTKHLQTWQYISKQETFVEPYGSILKFIDIEPESTNKIKRSYQYELSKLANRDFDSFNFNSEILKSNFSENKLVIDELNHMKNHFNNEIEYYCSYYLLYKTIKANS